MFFFSLTASTKRTQYRISRHLAIAATCIVLSACGGGGSGATNNPPSNGETPTTSNEAVWGEGHWDEVNWQ